MKNKSKLILASAVFIAALMLLVPLSQVNMPGGGGIGNSDSDSIVLTTDDSSVTKVSDLAGLQTAFNDARNNSGNKNIQLIKSISITGLTGPLSIPDGVILNLNGFTLSIPTIDSGNSNRIAIDDNATVTITNGKITYSGTDDSKSPIVVGKSKTAASNAQLQTLTLTDVNISSNGYGVAIFAKGNLTVNGGSITAVNSAISTNGGDPKAATTNSCDAVINLNGGQYVSTSTAAIFFPGGKTLNVNDNSQSTSTFFGKTGFDIRSGTVTINNATIYVTGDSSEKKTDDTGPTPWGMGIAIFDNAAYGKNTDPTQPNEITQTPINVTYISTTIVNAQYDYSIIGFVSYGNIKNSDGSLLSSLPTFTASHKITLTSGSAPITINKDTTNNAANLATSKTPINHPITIETINGDNFIFANGKHITISASGVNSKIEYGDSEKVTFVDNFDLSKFTVFGGKNNDGTEVVSTNITMNGGKVYGIAGGGYGEADVTESNVTVTAGTATYVTGGGWSTDSSVTVTTADAMTNRTGTTNVTISGGEVNYALGGGRLGYAYVGTANLTINGGNFEEIVAGGMNGYTGEATLTVEAKDGKSIKTGLISSGNRGQVGTANVTITSLGSGGSVKYVAIGALTWKTSTDGGPNAIFNEINFNIAKDLDIKNINLGGSAWTNNKFNPWENDRTNSLSDTSITINAPVYAIKLADVDGTGSAVVREYTIGAGKEWKIIGASIEFVASGNDISSIKNEGKLIFDNLNVGKNGLVLDCGGDIEIKNTDFTTKGLYIIGANDVTIQNCEFTGINTVVIDSVPDAIKLLDCSGDISITDNKISSVAVKDEGKPDEGMGINIYCRMIGCGDIEISDNIIENIAHNAIIVQAGSGKAVANIHIEDNTFENWDTDYTNNTTANENDLYFGGRAIRLATAIALDGTSNVSENTFIMTYVADSTYDTGNILKATKHSPIFKDNVLRLTGITIDSSDKLFKFDDGKTRFLVTFDANGGYFLDDSSNTKLYSLFVASESSATITEPDDDLIDRSGSYSFDDWYTLATGGEEWDFTTGTISENKILYAKWTYTGGSGGGVPITPPTTDDTKTEEVKNDDGTISSITETTIKKENADGSKETTVKKEEVVKDESGNVQSVIEEKQSEVVSKDGSVSKTSETTVKDSTGKVLEEKTEIEIEDKNTGVSTSVEITKDSNGKTTSEIKTEASVETKDGKAQVDSEALEEALKQAEEAKKTAEEKGAKNVTPVIEIEAENSKDFTETQISTDDLSKLAEAEVEVKIKTATGEVNLPPEVSKSLSSNADEKVSLSFGEADKNKLTEEQKKTVGDSPVFEFNLKSGENEIHDLGGTAKVTVPYELKAGEDPNKITVWYIDEEGKPVAMKSVYDPETKSITFETSHFSYYFIAEDAAAPDDNKDDSSNNSIYYAVAAIIVILIIIALAYYFMKKKQ